MWHLSREKSPAIGGAIRHHRLFSSQQPIVCRTVVTLDPLQMETMGQQVYDISNLQRARLRTSRDISIAVAFKSRRETVTGGKQTRPMQASGLSPWDERCLLLPLASWESSTSRRVTFQEMRQRSTILFWRGFPSRRRTTLVFVSTPHRRMPPPPDKDIWLSSWLSLV